MLYSVDAVCFGSSSCWKWTVKPSLTLCESQQVLLQGPLCLTAFILHSIRQSPILTDVALGVQSEVLYLCLISPESPLSAFSTEVTSTQKRSSHYTVKARLMEYFWDGYPYGRFSHLCRARLKLRQSSHWVLGHLPDQGLSSPVTEFDQTLVPKFQGPQCSGFITVPRSISNRHY